MYAYENGIRTFFDDFNYAYKLGLQDGSIKEVENIEVFYFTTTHALLELCKKLAADAKILKQDGKYSTEEVETLIKLFLSNLKK